jgi:lycopene beta-cyclase
MTHFDTALVGGGLQNGLIALATLRRRPEARVTLIEQAPSLGGDHTWCFHAGDVPAGLAELVDAITAYRWPGYEVRFPEHRRTIDDPYAGTTSAHLAAALEAAFAAAPGARLRLATAARAVGPDRVELAGGEVLTANLVVDARGPEGYLDRRGTGYQRFVGLELALAAPHGLERPLLIDATVPQEGGFRFMYVLPLAGDRVLVEDTTFATGPELDDEALAAGCLAYAAAAGLEVSGVIRRERGALPMPWQGTIDPPAAPLRAGYQGGWFHPATGYSFPVALRLADFVSSREPGAVIGRELETLWRQHMRQVRFCHRLNKMLFLWFADADQWNVFERFYKLPANLIRRFYALETTAADRARILVGRPPRGFSLRARLQRRAG